VEHALLRETDALGNGGERCTAIATLGEDTTSSGQDLGASLPRLGSATR
jgi:hypothetical protein